MLIKTENVNVKMPQNTEEEAEVKKKKQFDISLYPE